MQSGGCLQTWLLRSDSECINWLSLSNKAFLNPAVLRLSADSYLFQIITKAAKRVWTEAHYMSTHKYLYKRSWGARYSSIPWNFRGLSCWLTAIGALQSQLLQKPSCTRFMPRDHLSKHITTLVTYSSVHNIEIRRSQQIISSIRCLNKASSGLSVRFSRDQTTTPTSDATSGFRQNTHTHTYIHTYIHICQKHFNK